MIDDTTRTTCRHIGIETARQTDAEPCFALEREGELGFGVILPEMLVIFLPKTLLVRTMMDIFAPKMLPAGKTMIGTAETHLQITERFQATNIPA